MATAFVAGSTGYVGREVVAALAARKDRAAGHVRPDSPALVKWQTRFAELGAEVDATPWDEDALVKSLETLAPAVVFALLGTTRARAKRDPEASYEKVDYGLTTMLLRATKRAAPRARFVYLSSYGVSEKPTSNAYFETRRRVEAEVRASGLAFTIARPSMISGPDRDEARTGERIGAAAVDVAAALVGVFGARGLGDRWRSTDGKTLAAALVRVAFDPACEGRVLDGTDLR